MDIVLHEGHQHSETGSSAVGPEMMVVLTVGLVLLGAIAVYAAMRVAS